MSFTEIDLLGSRRDDRFADWHWRVPVDGAESGTVTLENRTASSGHSGGAVGHRSVCHSTPSEIWRYSKRDDDRSQLSVDERLARRRASREDILFPFFAGR